MRSKTHTYNYAGIGNDNNNFLTSLEVTPDGTCRFFGGTGRTPTFHLDTDEGFEKFMDFVKKSVLDEQRLAFRELMGL